MRYWVPALLFVSCCTLLHADTIPTYTVTDLFIHNQTTMSFSAPGISGMDFNVSGQVPQCCDMSPGPVAFNVPVVFNETDIFAQLGSSGTGTVNFGSGALTAIFEPPQSCSSASGGTFPSMAQANFPTSNVPAGTAVSITVPVTFCGIFPMWLAPDSPFNHPADFFVSVNLNGTGTLTLISEGLVNFGGSEVTAYHFGSLDYRAAATPEPATFLLCGLPLLIGAVKRFRASRL